MVTKNDCWDANLVFRIEDGFCLPFVAEIDGKIYVGDCDNLNEFNTLEEANMHCRGILLSPDEFESARRLVEEDPNGNASSEYRRHCDALLQLSALRRLRNAGTRV